jgi:hypothetical protein
LLSPILLVLAPQDERWTFVSETRSRSQHHMKCIAAHRGAAQPLLSDRVRRTTTDTGVPFLTGLNQSLGEFITSVSGDEHALRRICVGHRLTLLLHLTCKIELYA